MIYGLEKIHRSDNNVQEDKRKRVKNEMIPTKEADEEEKDTFYEELRNIMRHHSKTRYSG